MTLFPFENESIKMFIICRKLLFAHYFNMKKGLKASIGAGDTISNVGDNCDNCHQNRRVSNVAVVSKKSEPIPDGYR